MQRGTLILTGLLAAQLGLAGVLLFSSGDYGAFNAKEPVIAFDPAKIDQIAIDGTGAGSVTLKKENGKWEVPALANFPADSVKISLFLDKLRDLKKGFPVATSADAAPRFKVADNMNERRIVLSSGGKETAKLLVGTAPTFRLANVRGAGNDIYSVTFSSYEAATRGEDWMDREALAIPAEQVASVAFTDGVTLERKDNKFALTGLGGSEKPLDGKVQEVGRAVARPLFDAIQGKGAAEVAKLDNPDIQFEVKKTDGTARTYKYKKEAAGGAYLFAASDRDYVFRVAETSVAALADAKREKLIEQPDKTGAVIEQPNKASAAAPQPDKTGAAAEQPKADATAVQPDKAGAAAEQPKADAAAAQPDKTGAAPEQPKADAAAVQPDKAGAAAEQPKADATAVQPDKAGTAAEQPKADAAATQSDKAGAAAEQPKADAAAAQPDKTGAAPEQPKADAAAVQPDKTDATAEQPNKAGAAQVDPGSQPGGAPAGGG